jgi:hypothetical protein
MIAAHAAAAALPQIHKRERLCIIPLSTRSVNMVNGAAPGKVR